MAAARRATGKGTPASPDEPSNENGSAPEPIDASEARQHALVRLRGKWVGGGDELGALAGGTVSAAPLTILDIDGRPLFHEFEVAGDDGVVGVVRASASRTLGPAVLSTQLGPRRWDPDTALRQVTAIVKDEYRSERIKVLGADLVCYCWPKIGVKVRFSSSARGESAVIYDASDLVPIERYGGDRREGSTAYSFYAEQVEPRLEARRRRWQREEADLEILRQTVPQLLEDKIPVDREFRARLANVLELKVPLLKLLLTVQQTVRFGPRCSPHECMELYAQQTNVYCAVATGQMILDFHKWHFTQDQIAATMGTDAGGTSQDGQIAGYEGRSNGCLNATLDNSADWAEATAEIDANRPFKSGIPGHARCGAGYEWSWSFASWGFDRSLKVYDPWPWNADICQGGAITWEDWDAVDHTNFMYVRHRTTNHA
jgi:hypothetical protein